MGRDTSGRAPTYEEIVEHARWVHDETLWADINDPRAYDKAFEAAIASAYNMGQQEVIENIREDMIAKAVELDGEDQASDLAEDGVAALLWYAKHLNDMLPPEHQLENRDGIGNV